jgi:subtilisin family serine protease
VRRALIAAAVLAVVLPALSTQAMSIAAATPAPLTAPLQAPGPPDAPQWWVDNWQVHSLWAQGADGRGITIGEIDSGVNANLPQLSASVLPGIDFGASGGDGRVDRELDPFGHGTAMASIMVASPGPFRIEGLAPGAKILPIAIPLIGTEDAAPSDHLAEAIRWAADHGAKIINMSLGAARVPGTDTLACPSDEQSAVIYAISKGAILVAAAGNSGLAGSPTEEPGVCLGVVTVGAVNSAGAVAPFSSRHPYTTVAAPGVNIPSLGRIAGQAYTGQGTSQATALASAALALIWSKYPTLTGRQVLARLLATLDEPHNPADPAYGYGQINPQRAIATDVPATAPNVVFDAVDPFVALTTARAAEVAPVPPAPIVPAAAPPGQYRADAPASLFTRDVQVGSAVGVAGLLGLLLLSVFGIRRRRRVAVAGPVALTWSGPVDPAMPWQDIFPPPAWSAPAEPPTWTAPPDAPAVVYPPPAMPVEKPPTRWVAPRDTANLPES